MLKREEETVLEKKEETVLKKEGGAVLEKEGENATPTVAKRVKKGKTIEIEVH